MLSVLAFLGKVDDAPELWVELKGDYICLFFQ